MLKITAAQQQRFEEDARHDLCHDLLEHLRAELPDVWSDCSDDEGLDAVYFIFEQAEEHGFDTVGAVTRFAELMSLTGPEFGDPDEHERYLDILFDDDVEIDWLSKRETLVQLVQTEWS